MISLEKTGNAIKFTFDDNGRYLYNGTIEVPVNSLTLVTDDSEMFTFKKSATNDIFVSGLYSEIGMTKSELETFYKDNMVGSTGGGSGSGITSGEVQTMIDESISGKVNTVDNQVDAYGIETSSGETGSRDYCFSADSYANGAFYYKSEDALQEGYNRISGGIKIVDSSDNIVLDYTVPDGQATNIWNPSEYSQYFTVTQKNRYSATIEPSGDYRILSCNIYVKGEAIRNNAKYYITTAKYPSYQSAEAIENNVYPKLDSLDSAISGKADTSAVTAVNNVVTAHTADTTIHVTSADKTAWNAKSDFSGSYNDLTDKPTIPTVPTSNTAFTNDAGYITEDALSGKADSSAVTEEITAAVSGKLDTSIFETYSGNVETALSGKQDTLVSGTNIKTINNESLLGSGNIDIQGGGGGKAIEAGRGISITTGETADTVSFNLPISAGTGFNSIIEGSNTFAGGQYSHSEGLSTSATTVCSHTEGSRTIATNTNEHASGTYNVSNKASTTFGDSGNTLFSVGNGTADNARHNAFEIRQNGDIYLTKDGQDVKLQDQLGGSSITVDTALDSGSTNPVENRVIYNKIDEVEQVTAAGLNAVNDKFDGLKLKKLTQSQYDALSGNTDSNTLYVIVN